MDPLPHAANHEKRKAAPHFYVTLREAIIKRYFFQSLSLQLAFEKLIQIV